MRPRTRASAVHRCGDTLCHFVTFHHGAIGTSHFQARIAYGPQRRPVHIRRLHGPRRVPVARSFLFGAKTSQTDSATSSRRVRGSAPSDRTSHAQHLPLVAETRRCEKCLAPVARAIRPCRGSTTQSLCAALRHLHVLSTPWRALPRVGLRLADRSNSRAFRPFRSIAANTGLSAQAIAKHEPLTVPDVSRCTSAVSMAFGGCRSRAISVLAQKHRRWIQPQAHDVCEAVHICTAHRTRSISRLWLKRVGAKSVSHQSRELFARAEG
jgi:hypothetical protein